MLLCTWWLLYVLQFFMYVHLFEKMISQDRLLKFWKEKPTVTAPKTIFLFCKCPEIMVFSKKCIKKWYFLNYRERWYFIGSKLLFLFLDGKKIIFQFCMIGKDNISFSCKFDILQFFGENKAIYHPSTQQKKHWKVAFLVLLDMLIFLTKIWFSFW